MHAAEGDFFIPESKLRGAFDGDYVELAPLPTPGKKQRKKGSLGLDASEQQAAGTNAPAARVLRVIDRAHDTVVGRYEVAEPFGVVVPEDKRIPYDIFTMRSDNPDIPDGSIVRVRISQFPSRNSAATGIIEEVIGFSDAPGIDIELVIARNKLETRFSEASIQQAEAATLDEADALAHGYRDLTSRFIFTIDPADAKDFDDALSIERIERGGSSLWRLGIHIADVSHYVPWGSSIDLDARRRATSVYLVDRVIPMLPEALSDDLCSLRPHEVRRSMTVDVYLNNNADVVDFEAYPALIDSKARLAYADAQRLLDGYDAESDQLTGECLQNLPFSTDLCGQLAPRLARLSAFAKKRASKRTAKGGLDFDTVEAKVRLDEEGEPLAIDLRQKTEATSLVEEAMILANETVASFLLQKGFPCVYRVHEAPDADSLAALVPVFSEFSWFAEVDRFRLAAGNPHELQKVLALSAERPESQLVSSLVLRAQKRALYKPQCEGHFGLASGAYAHFTSPIRRYPDLIVHRMLRAALTKRPEKFDQEVAALEWLSEHSSKMERVAEKASRESQEIKMVEYLERFIGQRFHGIISGVAPYGIYVRLECTAEGLVPVRELGNDYFAFDAARYTLSGVEGGASYRLGEPIEVVLSMADAARGQLEFKLANRRGGWLR